MRTSCECWDPTPPSVRIRREGRASAIIMKIGILGGSFNPIHLGHLIIAQDALEAFGLDRILFMPCASPPHKADAEMVSTEHRLEMVEAAIADHAPFDVSAVEIERGGVSYSIDTVRQLQADDPNPEWNLIIGGDSLAEFHLWRDVEELLQLCAVLTIVRPGFERDQIAPASGWSRARRKSCSHTWLPVIRSRSPRPMFGLEFVAACRFDTLCPTPSARILMHMASTDRQCHA